MPDYEAFGLTLKSDLSLPELISVDHASDLAPDLVIETARLASPPLQVVDDGAGVLVAGSDVWMRWDGIGTFRIRSGREVSVAPDPDAEDGAVRLALLGPVLATLLHQRGRFVLHGSAVALDGTAAIFLGAKGWGKSTLAAALCGRGHALITDDVVAVRLGEDHAIEVIPGFPQCKLWPDAIVASIGDEPGAFPRLTAQAEKRSYAATPWFRREPVQLGCIFLLQGGDEVTTEPIRSREALVALIQHSYAVRFGRELIEGRRGAANLRDCARVVGDTAVYRLIRPRTLSRLNDTVDLVEDRVRSWTNRT